MQHPLVAILDFLLGFDFSQRAWFWGCVAFIIIDIIAIAANLMEPNP